MDVDIDLKSNFKPEKIFLDWVKASIIKDKKLRPHPCGVYPQKIAKDVITNLSSIPYEEAEKLGFLKIDFLHLHLYDIFENRNEIEELIRIEPDWNLLLNPEVQKQLFQLSNHADILSLIKPTSIEQIADCLALIRPGKKALAKLYKTQPVVTKKALYAKDENGYSFKKSHAVAYALVIVLQLHIFSTQGF